MSKRKGLGQATQDEAHAPPISIAILAEIRLFRESLAACLNAITDFSITSTTADSDLARSTIRDQCVRVALVDIERRFGLDTIESIKSTSPGTEIIALGASPDAQEAVAYCIAGASGFVSSEASVEELEAVIRTACEGCLLCTPEVARNLSDELRKQATNRQTEWSLTRRETQISTYLDAGYSNQEIADELHIEVSTVKNHVHNILEKLNVSRRGQVRATSRSQLKG